MGVGRQGSARRSVYRSRDGRDALHALYEKWCTRLPGPVERLRVATRFGETRLLAAGPPDAPPIMVHQGGNFPNPVTLAWFFKLASRYRIFAPDLPGAPGYSAPHHLDGRRGEFASWACDVLDGLGLDAVPHLGASFGAGIILHLATRAPERVTRMALIAPAGIVKPSLWRLTRDLALPMLRYRLRPSRENLEVAVAPLHSDPPSELLCETHAAVFQHLRLARQLPDPVGDHMLDDCHCPVLVIAGEDDPLFPGRPLLTRCRELMPQAETRLLPGSRHFPSGADLDRISGWLDAFMP